MIVGYTSQRSGQLICVTVTSDLVGSPIFYHWYVDGAYSGFTQSTTKCFSLMAGEQARIIVQDTLLTTYDPIANAPEDFPSRRSIYWNRSVDTDVRKYLVEQNRAAAGWTALVFVPHDENRWEYVHITGRLDDLISYQFRVTPVDKAGNSGTAVTFSAETVVRRPDAPDFTVGLAAGDVTFTGV